MEPIVRPLFTVCEIDGCMFVSAEIPGVEISKRPVFYKGVGRIKGSYIRVGESDEAMSEYEIYSYEAFRKRIRDDIRVIDNIYMNIVNEDRMLKYLNAVKLERRNLVDYVSEEELKELMGLQCKGVPTLANVMVFSRYPQAYFPQLCITAVCVAGTEIGDLGDDGERFIDNKRITGSISEMLEDAMDFVKRNMRTKTVIDEKGKRKDKPEYPLKAIREAILNALVHRDYSIHTENIPIRIEMYRDRIEIVNPGGLYGKIAINALGKAHPETRNAVLTNILELLKVTENRYSGIPTMRAECIKANLSEPQFMSVRGEFKVRIYNNIYQNISSDDAILNYCAVPRSRQELIEFVGKSKNYVMTQMIGPLLDSGRLSLSIPEHPKSPKQRYVKTK